MNENNITKINKEKNRLVKLLKKAPKDRSELHKMLIERAAFMLFSLQEMERIILSEGYITTMTQGAYEIDRAHPLLDKYNAMSKNYLSTTGQLDKLLPEGTVEKAGQEIMQFIAGAKK